MAAAAVPATTQSGRFTPCTAAEIALVERPEAMHPGHRAWAGERTSATLSWGKYGREAAVPRWATPVKQGNDLPGINHFHKLMPHVNKGLA